MTTFTEYVLDLLDKHEGRNMKTKLSILREHMAAGRWREAIRLAARFPQLGDQRGAILDAQLAYTSPDFCRGIRKDPAALIEAGIAALRARYQA